MKKILFTLVFVGALAFASAQKSSKLIRPENVERIVKTLTADDMMGRPASDPNKIEKATQFIEDEFKSIGLKTFKGLSGFRQAFTRFRIHTKALEVSINGVLVPTGNVLLLSEQTQIQITSGISIKHIDADPAMVNVKQGFLRKAVGIARDTASALVVVPEEFSADFNDLKYYFRNRFINNRKGTKVFVLSNLKPTTYTIKAYQQTEEIKMNNVVGMLPGKTRPDECVIFAAHYDHLGIVKAIEGDSIANGADDDASGTTAVIELARYFQKVKSNNRTLLFVAFTAEELGGFGSTYFSENVNPDQVIAMFNIEMIGKPSKFGSNAAFITGYERSDFGDILQKNLTASQFQFKPDPYPAQQLFYRSDNARLARLGVPAHSISTDQIDIDKLYHTVNDELESLDIENMTATIRAIALSSKTIVDGTDTPKRIDKTSVR